MLTFELLVSTFPSGVSMPLPSARANQAYWRGGRVCGGGGYRQSLLHAARWNSGKVSGHTSPHSHDCASFSNQGIGHLALATSRLGSGCLCL